MARYIDADKLWNDRPLIPEGKSQDYGVGFSECMWGFSQRIKKQIDNPADVVPKSEYDAVVSAVDNSTKEFLKLHDAYQNAKTEVAREIFEEIERFLYLHFRFCKEEIGNDDTEYVKGRLEHNTQMQDLIAELKKKYTEQ